MRAVIYEDWKVYALMVAPCLQAASPIRAGSFMDFLILCVHGCVPGTRSRTPGFRQKFSGPI